MPPLEPLVDTDPVASSNLSGYGYAAERQTLAVWFKSGDLWHHHAVPVALWTAFQQAPSKGTFYGRAVRGKFPSVKMTGHCPKCGALGIVGITCEDCGCAAVVADPPKPPRRLKADEHDLDRQIDQLAEHLAPDPRD